MGEMVANMRLLKAHAWELHFGGRLAEIRSQEMKHLDNDLLYRSIMSEWVGLLFYRAITNILLLILIAFLTHMSTVVSKSRSIGYQCGFGSNL